MRYALPASVVIHVALIGGAWLALNWAPPREETGVESVSVDIVSLEDFTSTEASTVQSSATETLVAAGSEAVEPTETIEPVEVANIEPAEMTPVAAAEPDQAETTEPVQVAAAEPQPPVEVETEATSSLDVLSAMPIPDAVPVEGLLPLTVTPSAAAVAAVAPTRPKPMELAAINPVAPSAIEPETLEPVADAPVAPKPLPRPKFLEQKEAEVAKEEPDPKPVKKEKPKEEPKEQPKKKKPVANAGNGGTSNANVAASAASGGKGKSDAAGNAAASKYPGLVQRALRRALRFPKGAGSARGEVQVTFVVSSSGAASQISVTQSSGHAVLDKEAMATVRRAKFPPIPEGAGRNSWTFTMPLAFTR